MKPVLRHLHPTWPDFFTTSKEDGHLCFHVIQTVNGTLSEDQRIHCYVIYYNEHRPGLLYPSYSTHAFYELSELEVYDGFACVLCEFQSFTYKRNVNFSNTLPVSDFILKKGMVSILECVLFCSNEVSCQTIFYKSTTGACFMYKYPLLEYTSLNPETGVEVYEIEGCSNPGFIVLRDVGICVREFPTSNYTYMWASEACAQNGGELISLDADKKIDSLSFYLLKHFGKRMRVTVGLRRYSTDWKWTNGQTLSTSHPNLTNTINNYDAAMKPCTSNFCGIFSVGSPTEFAIYDNCCNNLAENFVCSGLF